MDYNDDDILQQILPVFFDKARSQLLQANRTLLLLEQPEMPDAIRAATTTDLLRLLHTIKGDAGAVGMGNISTLAHALESSMKLYRQGELLPRGGEVFSLWFQTLDALSGMVERQDDVVDLAELETIKAGLAEPPRPEPTEEPAKPKGKKKKAAAQPVEAETAPAPAPPAPAPAEPAPASAAPAPDPTGPAAPAAPGEEVVRVTTRRLDRLAEGMSELMSMRLSHEQQLRAAQEQVQALLAEQDQWRKTLESLSTGIDRYYQSGAVGVETYQWLRESVRRQERNWLSFRRSGQQALGGMQRMGKDLRRLAVGMRGQEEELRSLRMTPVADLFGSFHRLMRDAGLELGKRFRFVTSGESVELDRAIVEELREPLVHLLRNAVDHGIEDPETRRAAGKPEAGQIALRAFTGGVGVIIEIEDDGRGLDTNSIRRAAVAKGLVSELDAEKMPDRQVQAFAFDAGFSTRAQVSMMSGRGVGLDVVRNWAERMRGRLEWESREGRGLLIRLTLPLTMATVQALLVRVGERKYAVPLSAVDRVRRTRREDVRLVEGRPSVMHDGQPVELALLNDLLGLGVRGDEDRRREFPVVMTWGSRGVLGLVVDELLGEQEIVLKNFSHYLRRVPNFAGAAILGNNEIILVLNCADLHHVAARGRGRARPEFFRPQEEGKKKRILVADDSLITRTMETRILAKAGFEVLEANDGIEAFDVLKEERVDLLVTDVQMPRMNGLDLTRKVRATQLLAELPVIIISFLDNEEDRMRGMEAGANAYLTKSQFTHNRFLSLVEQVIGGRE